MKKLSLVLILLVTMQYGYAQRAAVTEIRATLAAQQESWNNGNLEKFMNGYWQNDSLMFIGKSGVTYGWQNTLDNYKKGYPDKTGMGELKFDILHINKLSKGYYNVVGHWHLTRTIGDLQGHFSLLWKRIKGRWVIVQDHSS